MQELLPLRAWNAKVFPHEGGKRRMEFHGKWIHYMKEDGTWGDIDCNFKETETGWEVTDAPFTFRAPKTADGEAFFESNCRYDIWQKKKITDAPFGMYLSCPLAASVPGEPFDIDGSGKSDSIIYRNAFPHWGADLIYYVKHGRAPRLEKLVRFNEKPNEESDFPIPFDIRYTGKQYVRHVDGARKRVWDGEKIRTKEHMEYRPVGGKSMMRGVGMRDFFIWDANRKIKIDVDFQKTPEGFSLTKIIPVSFFQDAAYPVYTDATSTFYPDPNSEVTSVDGAAYRGSVDEPWATIRAAAGNASFDTGGAGAGIFSSTTSNQWQNITRLFFLFDTTALTEDIVSATLSLFYGVSGGNGDDFVSGNTVVATTPASNIAIVAADYQQVGSTALATSKLLSSISTGNYAVYTLNASGLANITKGGISKFGIRDEFDRANTMPTWASNDFSAYIISSAETSGTSNDPKLEVVFNLGAPTNVTVTSVGGYPRISWTDNSSLEEEFRIERKRFSGGVFRAIATDAASPYDDTEIIEADKEDIILYYRVRAYDSGGPEFSAYGTSSAYAILPAAPTNLRVMPSGDVTGNIAVKLTWDKNSKYETGFTIQRSTDGVSYSTIATAAKGATSYEDSGLTANTTYYYQVRAVGANGNSSYCTPVTVLTKMNTAAGLSLSFQKKVRTYPRE